MSDFHQTGVVATLHRLGKPELDSAGTIYNATCRRGCILKGGLLRCMIGAGLRLLKTTIQ